MRLFQCIRDRVTALNPAQNRSHVKPSLARGRARRSGLAIDDDLTNGALIEVLIAPRCPSAVLGRVRAIAVHAFKRIAIGTWPHVTSESCKIIAPLLAHNNPARAIVTKPLVCGAVTSTFSAAPRRVLARVRASVCGCEQFSAVAAATLRFTIPKRAASNYCDAPAVTATLPRPSAAFRSVVADRHEVSEPLAGNIDRLLHMPHFTSSLTGQA